MDTKLEDRVYMHKGCNNGKKELKFANQKNVFFIKNWKILNFKNNFIFKSEK